MRIEKVKYLKEFLDFKFPTSEYIFVNSVWLTLMDIRINGDLDVLISNKLWDKKFSDKPKNLSFGLTSKFEKRIRVHSIDRGPYMSTSFVISNDDLIYNNKIIIDGLPFIQPKLYFLYKLDRIEKSKNLIKNLPWWIRYSFFKGKNAKFFLKRNKDLNDLKVIKEFFKRKKHNMPQWVKYKKIDWGLEDKMLKRFFEDHINRL